MPRQDTNDFLAAFGIGAVLGIGAALLLRPEKPNPRKQLRKRLKPHVRKLGRSASRTRKAARAAAREAGTTTDDVIHAGRELLAEFRGEVTRILDEARGAMRPARRDFAALLRSLRTWGFSRFCSCLRGLGFSGRSSSVAPTPSAAPMANAVRKSLVSCRAIGVPPSMRQSKMSRPVRRVRVTWICGPSSASIVSSSSRSSSSPS